MEPSSSSKKKKIKRAETDSGDDSEERDEVTTTGGDGGGDDQVLLDNQEEEEDDEFDARAFIEEERSKLSALLEVFTDEELKRFEAARRCALKPKDLERIMELVLGRHARGAAEKALAAVGGEVPTIDERTIVVMGGLTKMYLQELIETACVVAGERGDSGRVQPRHLRESYRRMKLARKVPQISGGFI